MRHTNKALGPVGRTRTDCGKYKALRQTNSTVFFLSLLSAITSQLVHLLLSSPVVWPLVGSGPVRHGEEQSRVPHSQPLLGPGAVDPASAPGRAEILSLAGHQTHHTQGPRNFQNTTPPTTTTTTVWMINLKHI